MREFIINDKSKIIYKTKFTIEKSLRMVNTKFKRISHVN